MRDFEVEFEPTRAARKKGACTMSSHVRAWTAEEAIGIARQLLTGCGESLSSFHRPVVREHPQES